MSRREWFLSLQVAFTYIGTVVGAGFASGQEILKFFTQYAPYSSIGIVIACLFLGLVGSHLFTLGATVKARSYLDVTKGLLGQTPARILDISMVIMLFGVTVAMIAGVGALSEEHLGISFDTGALFTIALTSLVLFLGMKGLLLANSFIVPFMMTVIAFIFFRHLPAHFKLFGDSSSLFPDASNLVSQVPDFKFVASAIMYAAFNLGLSVVVLIPLGGEIQNLRVLKRGAWISATCLCLMLLAADWVMRQHYLDLVASEVPMGKLAGELGKMFQAVFLLALWAEIFSTLLSNVFGLIRGLPGTLGPHRKMRELLGGCLILIFAYGASHIGFSRIVEHVYPAFGFLSFLFLLFLLCPFLIAKRKS